MKRISSQFKKALSLQLRDKGYVSVSLGVISKEAQASAVISQTAHFSNNLNPLSSIAEINNEYATFEENHTKADGRFLFPPT